MDKKIILQMNSSLYQPEDFIKRLERVVAYIQATGLKDFLITDCDENNEHEQKIYLAKDRGIEVKQQRCDNLEEALFYANFTNGILLRVKDHCGIFTAKYLRRELNVLLITEDEILNQQG